MTTGAQREGYERVTVNGRRYLVCAVCRYPLVKGHDVMYVVPEVGDPTPNRKQSICGPCYLNQFQFVYPGQPIGGDLFDGRLEGAEPVPKLLEPGHEEEVAAPDDYELWELAIEQARASGGAETVTIAYKRLLAQPEVTGSEKIIAGTR